MAHSVKWSCDGGCGRTATQSPGRPEPAGWLTVAVRVSGNGKGPDPHHLCPFCGAEGFPGLANEIAAQVRHTDALKIAPQAVGAD